MDTVNIKNDLIEWANSYIEYSSIDFDIEKIKNINVEFASPIDKTVIGYNYNPMSNTLIVNKNYFIRNDIALENFYSDIILNVFHNNGFDCEEYRALNKGFREILANTLSGSSISSDYFESDEYVYANLMGQIVGVDTLNEAFAKNNPNLITEKLKNFEDIDTIVSIKNANDLANHNMLRATTKSSLPSIEVSLTDAYLRTNPSRDDAERFLANTVTSDAVFKDRERYVELNTININDQILNYINNLENENVKTA